MNYFRTWQVATSFDHITYSENLLLIVIENDNFHC